MDTMRTKRHIAGWTVAIGLAVVAISVPFLIDEISARWWLRRLDSDDPAERALAATELGSRRYGPAVPRLVELWLSAEPGAAEATDALLAFGDRARTAMENALEDADLATRVRTVRGLAECTAAPEQRAALFARLSRGADSLTAMAAIRGLQTTGPHGAAPLVVLLGTKRSDLRTAAIRALQSLGAAAVPALLDSVDERSPWSRSGALRLLAQLRSRVTSGEHATRIRAAAEAALEDPDPLVRGAALGFVDDLPDVHWSQFLDDPAPQIRVQAVAALAAQGNVAALEKALRDTHAIVRLETLKRWHEVAFDGGPERPPVELLRALLVDPSRRVRTAAFEVLAPLRASDVPLALRLLEDAATWSLAVGELCMLGEPAVEKLARTLAGRDAPELVRAGCAQALGEIGAPARTAILALHDATVASDDGANNGMVRFLAADAIARIAAATGSSSDGVRRSFGVRLPARPESSEVEPAVAVDIEAERGEDVVIPIRATLFCPIGMWELRYDLPEDVARPVRAEGATTAARVFFTEERAHGAFTVGALPEATDADASDPGVVLPGADRLLARLVLRIASDAPAGRWPLRDVKATLRISGSLDVTSAPVEVGAIVVRDRDAPARPEANRDSVEAPEDREEPLSLVCSRQGDAARLEWAVADALAATPLDAFEILRDGVKVADVPGSQREWIDLRAPKRPVRYTVTAKSAAAPGVGPSATVVWFPDRETWVYEIEDVRVEPGAKGVPIRIVATNSQPVQGFSLGVRVGSPWVRMRSMTLEGSATAAAENLFYQKHVIESGEVSAGIVMDMTPPRDPDLPAGLRRHVLTVLVDIAEDAPAGAAVRVELGAFGTPPAANVFAVSDDKGTRSAEALTVDGQVLIGATAVPAVRQLTVAPPGGDSRGLALEWETGGAYDEIIVMRNGAEVVKLDGDVTAWLDRDPGPMPVRYEVISRSGDKSSQPVPVTRLWADD